jgi:hypothetical protein
MSDEVNKELVLSAQDAPLTKRSKATLVLVGKRYISSDGHFHPDLAADYIVMNGRDKFLPVAELSKIFAGSNTISGKKRVRKSMCRVFQRLLNRGEFLLYHTGPNGRIDAVKLLNMLSDMERQHAKPQLDRMYQRRQLSIEQHEKALQVLDLQQALAGA